MKTSTLSMAAALVKFLQAQYVRRDGVEQRFVHGVWGIFGHGNVTGLGQALEEFGGRRLPYYQAKNEQAMVHAAAAFAKARQRLGIFACTSSVGPGATNMITGAATATVNRLPVLLLPGDIFANRRPAPVLQQLEFPGSQDVSVNDCFRPVSKYWDRLNRPEQLLAALPEAIRVLADPAETGAVTLCLPEDVQAESYAYPLNFFEKRVHTIERPAASTEKIRLAAAWIRAARRPLIIAGGGVHYSGATAALEKLCTATRLPVAVTQAGMGAVLDSHASCLGAIGVTGTAAVNAIATDADLIIAIGTRLADFTTASKTQFQHPRVRFINVNIHAGDAHKHGALPLVGDARAILAQLSRALAGWRAPAGHHAAVQRARTSWHHTRAQLVAPDSRPTALKQAEVIAALNEACGTTGTVVHAAGGIPGDIHKLWRAQSHDDYHSEYGYSCMGYEIAGAIGVKLARPEREVYAFLGDGSYLMLHTEIVTAVQEGLKITIVLNDNHGFGCIHNLQRGSGGRSFGNEFRRRTAAGRLEGAPVPVDFARNAESLGAAAFRARTAAELRSALAAAKRERGPVLIHVPVLADAKLPGFSWWDVPVSGTSGVPTVRVARFRYEKMIRQQRFHY